MQASVCSKQRGSLGTLLLRTTCVPYTRAAATARICMHAACLLLPLPLLLLLLLLPPLLLLLLLLLLCCPFSPPPFPCPLPAGCLCSD